MPPVRIEQPRELNDIVSEQDSRLSIVQAAAGGEAYAERQH